MKHPSNSVLQDYFENALNEMQEGLVKDHLLNCEECTKMLSEMALVERKMKETKAEIVPEALRLRILKDAGDLLQQRRQAQIEKSSLQVSRIQKQKEILDSIRGMWELFLSEFRTPALQFCSVSLVLVAIIAVEKLSTNEEYRYNPISMKVQSFGHKDLTQNEEEP
jgi:hypothetical protein